MRIRIVVGGKLDNFIKMGVDHYKKFLRRFCKTRSSS